MRVKAVASAALGVVERKGLGRLRHVHANFLQVQNRAAEKSVKYVKEKGSENPADMFTKNLARDLLEKSCRVIGLDLRSSINEEGFKLGAMERIAEDVAGATGGEDLEPWIRTDLQSLCLCGTRRGGPNMSQVIARRTYDLLNGKFLHQDHMESHKAGFKPFWEHRSFDAPKDIVTVLLFEKTRPQ